jgi:hypothetical protein
VDDKMVLMPPIFLDKVTAYSEVKGGYHVCGQYMVLAYPPKAD